GNSQDPARRRLPALQLRPGASAKLRRRGVHRVSSERRQMEEQLIKLSENTEDRIAKPREIGPVKLVNVYVALGLAVWTRASSFQPNGLVCVFGFFAVIAAELAAHELIRNFVDVVAGNCRGERVYPGVKGAVRSGVAGRWLRLADDGWTHIDADLFLAKRVVFRVNVMRRRGARVGRLFVIRRRALIEILQQISDTADGIERRLIAHAVHGDNGNGSARRLRSLPDVHILHWILIQDCHFSKSQI